MKPKPTQIPNPQHPQAWEGDPRAQPCRPTTAGLASVILAGALCQGAHAALSDRLEVYLNFDGTLEGQMGTTVNGTVVPSTRQQRFVPGMFGEAASFMNRDAQSVTDWAVSLGRLDAIYTNSFSVGLWVRTGFRSTSETLFWAGNGALTGNWDWSGMPGWLVTTHFERQVTFQSVGSSGNVAIPDFSDSRWHHLVLSFDREANRLIVHWDGRLIHSAHRISADGRGQLSGTTRTLIGASGSGEFSGAADIDDYAIWSRALTLEEVARIHGAGLRGLSLAQVGQAAALFTHTVPSPHASQAAPTTAISTTIESGTVPVDAESIRMTLDGVVVIPSVTLQENRLVVSYRPPERLASLSKHQVRIAAAELAPGSNALVHEWTFTVASYTDLPAAYALPLEQAGDRGFRARTVWASSAAGQLPTSLAQCNAQLHGTLIDPRTGAPYANDARPGPNPDGSWNVDVVNFNDTQFAAGSIMPDARFPGLTTGDSFSTEVLGYLELKAGYHQLGVNSDGGCELRFGAPARDLFGSVVAGAFDGGRYTWDTLMHLYATADGLYPFRLISFESSGRAALEFFSIDAATGKRTLVNDPKDPAALRVFRTVSSLVLAPYVRAVRPARGTLNAPPDTGIGVEVVDGTTELAPDSVQLKLNGQIVPHTLRKEGEVTFVTGQATTPLAPGSLNTVSIRFDAGDESRECAWPFGVVQAPQSPAVTGQWDFDLGDLSATFGLPLAYYDGPDGTTAAATQFGTAAGFGIALIEGQDAKVMRFAGAAHRETAFVMPHGAAPAAGAVNVLNWTMVLDLLVPNTHHASWLAMVQLNSALNQNRADLFMEWIQRRLGEDRTGSLRPPGGPTTATAYLQRGAWHRLGIVVDGVGRRMHTYLDGRRTRSSDLATFPEVLVLRGPELLLFADDSGYSQEVYVNSIQFRNYVLTAEEMAALGGPAASGIPRPDSAPLLSVARTPDGFVLSWAPEFSEYVLERCERLDKLVWERMDPMPPAPVMIPAQASGAFFRLRR